MGLGYIPMVRAGAIFPFLGFLREIGAPVDRLSKQAHLNGKSLEDPEGLVSLPSTNTFLHSAARSQGLSTLGLEVGQRTAIEELGLFGLLVRQSATLGEAIATGRRLLRAFDSSALIWMERKRDQAWLCRRSLVPHSANTMQTTQYGLMLLRNLIRLAAGASWKPAEVRLQMPWDPAVARFEALSDAKLLFDQDETALRFPAEFLSRAWLPVWRPDSEARADDVQRLQASAPATDLAGSMKQLLLTQLGEGPGIQRMADLSGLSVRTLQRSLGAEGICFSELIERVRFEQAVRLLQETDTPVNQIARELGYHDSANFTRAFRRWKGYTPSQFRDEKPMGKTDPEADPPVDPQQGCPGAVPDCASRGRTSNG